jgi:hypothetical protein
LEVEYKGAIFADEIIRFWDHLHVDQRLPRQLRVLTDASQAEYHIQTSDFPGILQAMRVHLKAYEWIKAAFIQTKPKETAFSIYLENNAIIDNYFHAVFSDRETAMNWLFE